MARDRLSLHSELVSLCNHVYYNPPESLKLEYPCIVYAQEPPDVRKADNKRFIVTNKWQLVVISKDVDYDLAETIAEHFEKCAISRIYKADNLQHWSLTLYY